MPKPTFKPYHQHQLSLLPQNLEDMIPLKHMVRIVDNVIESIDLSVLKTNYNGGGAPAYDPKMMLKVIAYAYAGGIYSSRKIAQATCESIYFLWLTGQTSLDHMTINRFRTMRLGGVLEDIFTEIIMLIADAGYITLDTYFLDGTKIEAAANKYSFVWKKATENYRNKLRQKVKEHFEAIDKLNDEEDALYDLLPEEELITADDIAKAAKRINERLKTDSHNKNLKQVKKALENDYLPRMQRYESHLKLCDNRNSFSKTDTDATFMRLKDDHMQNGQLKAAYNIQMGTENQFVIGYTLHHNPGDTSCLPTHFDILKERIGHIPNTIVADAGYGSEENYNYLRNQRCTAYIKYNTFHREQQNSFKKDPINTDNWLYDGSTDSYTCANGKQLNFLCTQKSASDLGYISQIHIYECNDCFGCPYHLRCTKNTDDSKKRRIYVNPVGNAYRKQAASLLLSDKGVSLRHRRAVDVESVFGNIKNNYHFLRFSLRGLSKTTLEFGLVALGHNLRKLCTQGLKTIIAATP